MLKEKNNEIRKAQFVADMVLTTGTFFLAYFLRKALNDSLGPIQPLRHYAVVLYIILPLWGYFFYSYLAYISFRIKGISQIIWPVARTVFTGGIVIMTILYILKLGEISRSFILIFLFVNLFVHSLFRCLIYFVAHYIRKKGYNYRTVLIVGTGRRAKDFAKFLEGHLEWGIRVIGFVDHKGKKTYEWPNSDKIVGPLSEFKNIITSFQVDEVMFVLPRNWIDKIEEQILLCEKIGIKASITADLYPLTVSMTMMDDFGGWPMLSFNPAPRLQKAIYAKRAFDIMVSSIALIFLSPVMLGCMIAVKLSGSGSIFFSQERCGMNSRRFRLFKFRTMVENAEKIKKGLIGMNEMSGPVFKIKKDPRVTRVGSFLRKYSLDELPQLINVFKGDMSIVGPRPLPTSEVMCFDVAPRRRQSVKPGITCIWQVSGRNKIGFADWMKLDLEYIDKWSLKRDFMIILKTIPAVLKGTGH